MVWARLADGLRALRTGSMSEPSRPGGRRAPDGSLDFSISDGQQRTALASLRPRVPGSPGPDPRSSRANAETTSI